MFYFLGVDFSSLGCHGSGIVSPGCSVTHCVTLFPFVAVLWPG